MFDFACCRIKQAVVAAVICYHLVILNLNFYVAIIRFELFRPPKNLTSRRNKEKVAFLLCDR